MPVPRVLVIGGGLAGLSAGFHLKELQPEVFEKESVVGGVCRSYSQDGFTFDVTGHLLHLKNDYTKELIAGLLPDAFTSIERNAAVHSHNRTTPYPFQANTFGLPADVVRDCLIGFIESLQQTTPRATNFRDWALETFGWGIAKHFMHPYNEKFWKTPLETITSDWVSWSIPKPTLEEVVRGALGIENKGMGYNPRFSYPKAGGIDCLPNALAGALDAIHLDHELESIDLERSRVRFTNGRTVAYDSLVTTVPLPRLFELIEQAPDRLRAAARRLRAISVLDLNIGVDRDRISHRHWIYFPEPEYIFTRVGFPANFSSDVVPSGTSSMYVEITHHPGTAPEVDACYERALLDLKKAGILRSDDTVLTRQVIDIEYAYVVFDIHRQQALPELISFLEAHKIHSCGRYGEWDYFSMEDSILSGRRAAAKVAEELGIADAVR